MIDWDNVLPQELLGNPEHAEAVSMIIEAAKILKCVSQDESLKTSSIGFFWKKESRYNLWTGVFILEDAGYVKVEPFRKQTRIESERGRDHYYDTAKELAGSIRSRLYRQ